jgi:aldose 1-epimerase
MSVHVTQVTGDGLDAAALSGRQVEISSAGQRAWIVEVGGGLRAYSNQRREVLDGYAMTCAPNAFQSGEGLVILEPGESFAASWGIEHP